MKDIIPPSSLLDFADALRLIAQSQSDVTELVVKWNEIMDTTSPATVSVLVGGLVKQVDNLAKIRESIVKGLSLDKPTVSEVHYRGIQASSRQTATTTYSKAHDLVGQNPYDPTVAVQKGAVRNVYNDYQTVVIPTTSDVLVSLFELPKVMLVGAITRDGVAPVTTLNLHITPPWAITANTADIYASNQYSAITKFVNRYNGNVTINFYDATSTLYRTKVIPAFRTVEFLFFAAPGQTANGSPFYNLQELVPAAAGGIE
jgi:hypothetical protein